MERLLEQPSEKQLCREVQRQWLVVEVTCAAQLVWPTKATTLMTPVHNSKAYSTELMVIGQNSYMWRIFVNSLFLHTRHGVCFDHYMWLLMVLTAISLTRLLCLNSFSHLYHQPRTGQTCQQGKHEGQHIFQTYLCEHLLAGRGSHSRCSITTQLLTCDLQYADV